MAVVHETRFYAFSFISKGAATSGQQQPHSDASASSLPAVASLDTTNAITPSPISAAPEASVHSTPLAVQPATAQTHASLAKSMPKNSSAQAMTDSAAKLPDGLEASASEPSVTSDGAGSGPSHFAVGDHVRVQLEEEIVKMMQEGHGGWQDDMAEVRTESDIRAV